MLDGRLLSKNTTPAVPMNLNSASPKMKKSLVGRGSSGRPRNKPPQNSGPLQGQGFDGLYQNDRLVNTATSLLGCPAQITEKSGKKFEGVFKTISPEGSLVLGKARQVEDQHQNGVVGSVVQRNDVFEQFVMNRKDWAKVEFKDVDLHECYLRRDGFKTDNAIAKKINEQPQKELERWVPGEDIDGSLETNALEESHTMSNGGWSAEEMLRVNKEKYGVKSTYDESMEEYTTKLEKCDTPEYREKEKFAERKAQEIAEESPYERNTVDSGRSEEFSYSAVVRKKHDRSTPLNWRHPSQDRSDIEQRAQKVQRDPSGSPVIAKKEPAKSPQIEEVPKTQLNEKVVKPVVQEPVAPKKESSAEASTTEVKDPPKTATGAPDEKDQEPPQNTSPAKAQVGTAAKPPTVIPTSPKVTPEVRDDPGTPSAPSTASERRKEQVEALKNFSEGFMLRDKYSKEGGSKAKKGAEEKEKISKETGKEDKEKEKERQTPQETKVLPESATTSAEKKVKSSLNPNAAEFRPVKRNSPSPRSNSTPSSSGAASPFQTPSPYAVSPYPTGSVYSRQGPRGRGARAEYVDHPNYVSVSNATGQPFFAQPMQPHFIPQPPSYVQPGNIRHPGLQTPVYLPSGQPPMLVPVGPGPYSDGVFYGPPAMQMIQSPPQISSPSLQTSQFTFPSPSLHPQPVNAVRPVSQPQQPVVLIRQPAPNEIQQTIISSRPPPPPQAQTYQGN